MRGLFITVEGVEGSGKSTHCRRLGQWLRSRGIEVVLTSEPDGTPLGAAIRGLFEKDGAPPTPLTQTFLFMAARQQHVAAGHSPRAGSRRRRHLRSLRRRDARVPGIRRRDGSRDDPGSQRARHGRRDARPDDPARPRPRRGHQADQRPHARRLREDGHGFPPPRARGLSRDRAARRRVASSCSARHRRRTRSTPPCVRAVEGCSRDRRRPVALEAGA